MQIEFDEVKTLLKFHIENSLVYNLWTQRNIPLIVERDVVKILLNPPLPVGYILGDWGQGKTTAGLLAANKAAQTQNLQVTYLSLEVLAKKLGDDANIRKKAMEKLLREKGLEKREVLTAYPDNILKNIFLLILSAIVFPRDVLVVYNLEADDIPGIKSNFSVPIPPDILRKRRIGDIFISLDEILRRRQIKYVILIDEIEGLEEFPRNQDWFARALAELVYGVRNAYDVHGNRTNLNIIFLVPTYYSQFMEKVKSILREEDKARALGIFAKFGDIPAMNENELEKYVKRLLSFLELRQDIIPEKNLKAIISQVTNLSERTRGRIAYLNNLILDIIIEAYKHKSKKNYLEAVSRQAIDIVQAIANELRGQKISSELLSKIMGELGPGELTKEVSKDIKKQELLLEALIEYFSRELGSLSASHRIQIWKGKRSRGYVCDVLKVSDGRRDVLYVFWIRFTRLWTVLDEGSLLRRLGLIRKQRGKIIKPQIEVKVILVYPEDISMLEAASLKNVIGFALKKEVIHALLAIKGVGLGTYGDYEYYKTLLERELRDKIRNLLIR
ncbi:MAG: hypothetical protein ACTSX9_06780 [Candidatus Njordarchaeales archaeon]